MGGRVHLVQWRYLQMRVKRSNEWGATKALHDDETAITAQLDDRRWHSDALPRHNDDASMANFITIEHREGGICHARAHNWSDDASMANFITTEHREGGVYAMQELKLV